MFDIVIGKDQAADAVEKRLKSADESRSDVTDQIKKIHAGGGEQNVVLGGSMAPVTKTEKPKPPAVRQKAERASELVDDIAKALVTEPQLAKMGDERLAQMAIVLAGLKVRLQELLR